jgi:hypothetical protein
MSKLSLVDLEILLLLKSCRYTIIRAFEVIMPSKAAGSRPSRLSEEFVHDSSDEYEESDSSPEPGSDEESGDAGDGDRLVTNTDKHVVNGGTFNGVNDEEESSPSSGDREADPDDEPSEQVNSNGKRPLRASRSPEFASPSSKQASTGPVTEPDRPPSPSEPTRIEPKLFVPPADFQPLILSASDFASEAPRMLSNLDGKQIWHIVAPSWVNVQNIEQFDIASALKGEPIFSDGSISYTMQPYPELNTSILVSSSRDAVYKKVSSQVEQAYQLQIVQKADSSILNSQPSRVSHQSGLPFIAKTAGESKMLRQQPEGLKSRYTPFGVNKNREHSVSKPVSKGVAANVAKSTGTDRIVTASHPPIGSAPAQVGSDENTSTPKRSPEKELKTAEPSTDKPMPASASGEKTKKRKKRSKLVDIPSL